MSIFALIRRSVKNLSYMDHSLRLVLDPSHGSLLRRCLMQSMSQLQCQRRVRWIGHVILSSARCFHIWKNIWDDSHLFPYQQSYWWCLCSHFVTCRKLKARRLKNCKQNSLERTQVLSIIIWALKVKTMQLIWNGKWHLINWKMKKKKQWRRVPIVSATNLLRQFAAQIFQSLI